MSPQSPAQKWFLDFMTQRIKNQNTFDYGRPPGSVLPQTGGPLRQLQNITQRTQPLRDMLEPSRIYHGTAPDIGRTILREGFIPSKRGWMGSGVYASHDPGTAALFNPDSNNMTGGLLRGNINNAAGARVKRFTFRDDQMSIFGLPAIREELGRNINPDYLHLGEVDFYTNLKKVYPDADIFTWDLIREPQAIFAEPETANSTFRTGGKQFQPRPTPPMKVPRVPTALTLLRPGNRQNSLLSILSTGIEAGGLAEAVAAFSEAIFGPLDPEKRNSDSLKINK